MTIRDHDLLPEPASDDRWADRLPGAFRAAAAWGSAAWMRRATTQQLQHLGDHILKDIGLRRDEILKAARQDNRRRRRPSLLQLGSPSTRVL